MLRREKLIEIIGTILPGRLVTNERTIRYYEYEGIVSKPQKIGRKVWYSGKHLKQLLAIRLCQDRGLGLASIRKRRIKSDPDTVLMEFGWNPTEVERMATGNSEHETKKRAEITKSYEHPKEMSFRTQKDTDKPLQVTSKNFQDYMEMSSYLRLGSTFAYVAGLKKDGELAKKIYRLLYGQISVTRGAIEEAVIPVMEDDLELPGIIIPGRKIEKNKISIIVSDKDLYKEGDDVATLFLFNPACAGSPGTTKAEIFLDGALLDQHEVELDENGCGIVRVATYVSGGYEAKVSEWHCDCRFDVAKYELAPLEVTTSGLNKNKGHLIIGLAGRNFGVPYQGKASVDVVEDGKVVQSLDAKFNEEGQARLRVPTEGRKGQLALRVVDEQDSGLVAHVPLPGSGEKDRIDTIAGELGTVKSVSLVPGKNSVEEKGLWFSDKACRNTPVRLQSCVGEEIILKVEKDVRKLVVVQQDAITGLHEVTEYGTTKAKSTLEIKPAFSLEMVHVGMFVEDKPWEGHSVFLKRSRNKISIDVPSRVDPGEEVRIKIRAPNKSSVLLAVRDKRLRVAREPMTAMASAGKKWLSDEMGGKWTGESGVKPFFCKTRVSGAQGSYDILPRTLGLKNMLVRGMSSTSYIPSSSTIETQEVSLNYCSNPGFQACRELGNKGIMPCNNQMKNEVLTVGGISFTPSVEKQAEQLGDAQPRVEFLPARESVVDLVFCNLLRVNGTKEVLISLPDGVAGYEFRAFCVNQDDGSVQWSHAEAETLAEKDMYIEPMIPQVAHPDDGVRARAVVVGNRDIKLFVMVDGVASDFDTKRSNGVINLSWDAKPGVHEVILEHDGSVVDKIVRVTEAPGEETVLTQEMRVLQKGETQEMEDDMISMSVLPGIETELKKTIKVCLDFQHSCCEQTAAKIVAASLALFSGGDDEREKAARSIVKGEAYMKSMWEPGKGFQSYPGSSIYQNWSAKAAMRLVDMSVVTDADTIPAEVRKSARSLQEMAKDVLEVHGGRQKNTTGEMELAYYEGRKVVFDQSVTDGLRNNSWHSPAKSEAAFHTASLFRDGDLRNAIPLANEVSKSLGASLGGGMHGTCETLAYLMMIKEMRAVGVVGGSGNHANVDGEEEVLVTKAGNVSSYVKATSSPVAVCINRLHKIKMDDYKSDMGMSVEMQDRNGMSEIKKGRPLVLKVKLEDGYQNGDVLCVTLPSCLSRIIGGGLAKKFQIDFSGKDSLDVGLLSHNPTDKPQRWSAVVRNMYDPNRIGSLGVMKVSVS